MEYISLEEITRPTLLLDEVKCKRNIRKMNEKIRSLGIEFRPHFKTHQSKAIATWFKEVGVTKITVSSLKMAQYFMQTNWSNILIAFPVNLREFDEMLKVSKLVDLKVVISDFYSLEFLKNVLTVPLNIYLEIDVGYKRSGFDYEDIHSITNALKIIQKSKSLIFEGIISHNGLTYFAKSKDEVLELNQTFLMELNKIKRYIKEYGFDPILAVGDTPSASIANEFPGVDELHPGNFVFYDLMQMNIGSCDFNDIAVCVAAPVVAVYPERKEIIAYVGAIHLSKEYVEIEKTKVYGLVSELSNGNWTEPVPNSYVSRITQEHSIIKMDDKLINRIKPGELIGIIPVHSCLTADAMKSYCILKKGFLDHL
jgi:D-serine deaminase-like pyridoxal phosphate-dependent protein